MSVDATIQDLKKRQTELVHGLVLEYSDRNQSIENLRRCMGAHAKQKAMTVLRLRSFLGAQEVADLLGISRAAVYSLLDEARNAAPTMLPLQCGHAAQPDALDGKTVGDVAQCPICGEAVIVCAPEDAQ